MMKPYDENKKLAAADSRLMRRAATELLRRLFARSRVTESDILQLDAFMDWGDVSFRRRVVNYFARLFPASSSGEFSDIGVFSSCLRVLTKYSAFTDVQDFLAMYLRSPDPLVVLLTADAIREVKNFSASPPPGLNRALMDCLEHPECTVRRAVASGLSMAVSDAEVRTALSRRLTDTDQWVRLTAAATLAPYAEDPELQDVFPTWFQNETPDVCRRSLLFLKNYVALPVVTRALFERLDKEMLFTEGSPDLFFISDSLNVLKSNIKHPNVTRAFLAALKFLENDRNDDETSLLETVGSGLALVSGRTEVRAALMNCFRTGRPALRAAAATALAPQIVDPEVRPLLLEALRDPSALVRCAAAQALAPHVALPAVRATFVDVLRRGAPQAMTHLLINVVEPYCSETEVCAVLLTYAAHPSPSIAAAAVEALSPLRGAPDVRAVLLRGLESDSDLVRMTTVRVLRDFAAEPEIQPKFLRLLLHDASPAVRQMVVDVLGPHTNAAVVRRALAACLDDDCASVARAAADALAPWASEPEVRDALMRNVHADEARFRALTPALCAAVNQSWVQESLLVRLTDAHASVRLLAAKTLAPAASQFPRVAAAFLNRIGEEPDGRVAAALVSALSPHFPDQILDEFVNGYNCFHNLSPHEIHFILEFFKQSGVGDSPVETVCAAFIFKRLLGRDLSERLMPNIKNLFVRLFNAEAEARPWRCGDVALPPCPSDWDLPSRSGPCF